MKILLVLSVIVIGGFVSSIAHADEFGERFYNQAPQGLGEFTADNMDFDIEFISMDDIAASLQDIMPAAGGEDDSSLEQNSLVQEETTPPTE